MKAMILAAGKGTRVRPLTYDLPKPMIPILGKPVMEYLVEHLVRYGVQDIMVNVSYLHEKIEQYFGDGQRLGAHIGYSFEGYVDDEGEVHPQPVGSAGGMRKIQDFGGFFDETTLVICGDALIDLDIRSALFEHKRKGALVSVITKEVPLEQVSSYGIVVTDNDGRVRSFQEKPSQEEALSRLASTGIYIMEPEVLDLIPSDTFFDIGSDLFPLIVEKGLPFYAQKRHFNWIDIGNVKDFLTVQLDILSGRVAQMYVPGVEVAERVWTGLNTRIDWDNVEISGPVFFGSGCHVEAGARIVGPAWIGHGSHICSNTLVERSVLFEYTRIAEGSTVQDAVVYGDYTVSHAGEVRHISEFKDNLWNDARDRRLKPRIAAEAQD